MPPQSGRFSIADLDPAPPQAREVALTISSGAPPPSGRFSPADVDAEPASLSRAIDLAADAVPAGVAPGSMGVPLGMAKEGLAQVTRLGNLARLVPGVSQLDRLIKPAELPQEAVTPSTPSQRAGQIGLNVAETVLPATAITRAGNVAGAAAASAVGGGAIRQAAARLVPRMAVEGVAGAGTSLLQGGDPVKGGLIAAAVPAVGAAAGAAGRAIGPKLKDAAVAGVVKALGPTKERFKAMAEKIAPQVLQRGIRGSREAIQAEARGVLERVGPKIDAGIAAHGTRTADTQQIIDAIETAKDDYRTVREITTEELKREPEVGRRVMGMVKPGVYRAEIPTDARVLNHLSGLQDALKELGPEARVDQLVAMRRAWDDVVAQAGGYAHRAPGGIGVPLADSSEAWAKREGAKAIRSMLNETIPELSSLNKEYAFWKTLDDVTTQTLKRQAPQGPSLGRQIASAAGSSVGAMIGTSAGGPVGGGAGAFLGQLAGPLRSVFKSPRWTLASARLKDALADAIMSGNRQNVEAALSQIAGGPVNAEVSRPSPAIP